MRRKGDRSGLVNRRQRGHAVAVKFDDSDRADASQVEDRRGTRFPGGRMGAGVGGLGLLGGAVYLVLQVLAAGGNQTAGEISRVIDQSQRSGGGVDPSGSPSGLPAGPSGSCRGVDSTNDPAKFIVCVESNVQAFWGRQLAGHGAGYRPAKLVLFSEATPSACGTASAQTGPFYCPPDQQVYLDLSFFSDMKRKLGAPGDFAAAYVVAHEVGHHVQNQLGIMGKADEIRAGLGREDANALSVRLELQADCFAGIWANHAQRERNVLEPGDIDEALNAAAAVGDDRLQQRSQGYIVPESFTHGTSEQRIGWFKRGFESGTLNACDTFNAANL